MPRPTEIADDTEIYFDDNQAPIRIGPDGRPRPATRAVNASPRSTQAERDATLARIRGSAARRPAQIASRRPTSVTPRRTGRTPEPGAARRAVRRVRNRAANAAERGIARLRRGRR